MLVIEKVLMNVTERFSQSEIVFLKLNYLFLSILSTIPNISTHLEFHFSCVSH